MRRSKSGLKRWISWGFLMSLSGGIVLAFFHSTRPTEPLNAKPLYPVQNQVTREHVTRELKAALESWGPSKALPVEMEFPVRGNPTPCVLQYSIQSHLQLAMEGLFESYRPDFGAFVAIDADTGKILSLVNYAQNNGEFLNLALKGSLPSASVFKVVTAAAAIAKGKFSADSILPMNGQYHTLYRRNVFDSKVNRWTRFLTLKEAFGKSVNSVFGRIGAVFLSPQELRQSAENFGFNRMIASDIPFEMGRARITDDTWELAEAASGYTQDNTMSPLQGALIAAAVANDGVMMEPYVVESVLTESGVPVYSARPQISSNALTPQAAGQLRRLMHETVVNGTARSAFRKFFSQVPVAQSLEVGGKTGSLSGTSPEGKYDWFVGYARGHGQKIAFATLTINKKYWKVKSAYLARRAIESYFSEHARVSSLKLKNVF